MNSLKIKGINEDIPIGKILCIGRNYEEHIKEMKAKIPEEPIIFQKPASSLVRNGEPIRYPPFSSDLQHEVELVIVMGKKGKNITQEDAYEYVLGYAVGLDMTLRDVQSKAKKEGLPWTIAKGFDTSAPVSDVILKERIPDPQNLIITCSVNGSIRQKSSTKNMISPVDKIISQISKFFTLEKGDLIFTGTPEGISSVHVGDIIDIEITGYIKSSHKVIK